MEFPPTLQNSVFVLMDILGYSDLIATSTENETYQDTLRKLHEALSKGRKWLEGDQSPDFIFGEKDHFALKAFTDNIAIGWPIHDDA